MKTVLAWTVVMLVALLVGFAGISQAGVSGPIHKGTNNVESWSPMETRVLAKSDRNGESASSESEFRKYNSLDTVEHWGPVEVGALPGADREAALVPGEVTIDSAHLGEPTPE